MADVKRACGHMASLRPGRIMRLGPWPLFEGTQCEACLAAQEAPRTPTALPDLRGSELEVVRALPLRAASLGALDRLRQQASHHPEGVPPALRRSTVRAVERELAAWAGRRMASWWLQHDPGVSPGLRASYFDLAEDVVAVARRRGGALPAYAAALDAQARALWAVKVEREWRSEAQDPRANEPSTKGAP